MVVIYLSVICISVAVIAITALIVGVRVEVPPRSGSIVVRVGGKR